MKTPPFHSGGFHDDEAHCESEALVAARSRLEEERSLAADVCPPVRNSLEIAVLLEPEIEKDGPEP